MRPIPRSYSPRFRAQNYDALADAVGCQALTGNTYDLTLPFTTECLYETTSDARFFIDPRISYFIGPSDHESPAKPFQTQWAAWVSSTGVRVGQRALYSVTLPDNGQGFKSQLYPNTVPTQLSAGFANDGFLAIAIQKTPGTIEIRKYNSLVDPNESIFTTSFAGLSPALINTGLAFSNESGSGIEMVCYYLHEGSSRSIYARFLSDGFSSERVINPGTRLYISSFLGANIESGKVVLRGKDTDNRYVKYSTKPYAINIDDLLTFSVSITSGTDTQTGFVADLGGDLATVTIAPSIVSGTYAQSLFASENTSDQPTRIGVSIPRGSYKLSS